MEVKQHASFKSILYTVIAAITFLWVIKGVELLFQLDFRHHSIYPCDPSALLGLVFGSVLHSTFEHVSLNYFSNGLTL
jgi:hypothetical protein